MNKNQSLFACGDQRGNVSVYSLSRCFNVQTMKTDLKTGVMYLNWIENYNYSKSNNTNAATLLMADAIGEVKVFSFNPEDLSSKLLISFRLPVKSRLTTALLLSSIHFNSNSPTSLLFCGDAKGSIYCYSIHSNPASTSSQSLVLLFLS